MLLLLFLDLAHGHELTSAEDYYRYIAEFRGTDPGAVARASEVYQEAIDAVQDRWSLNRAGTIGTTWG